MPAARGAIRSCWPAGLSGAVGCAVLCGIPALAEDHEWYGGEWCGDGGRYWIGRLNVSAGDHVLCRWIGRPPSGRRIDALLRCEAFYSEGTIRMDVGEIRVRGDAARPEKLSLMVQGAGAPSDYQRCD